jgi:hypothetical protein
LDSEWNEFKYFSILKQFAIISFKESMSSIDLDNLKQLPVQILHHHKSLSKELRQFDFSRKKGVKTTNLIYYKLHKLTHYYEYVLKFSIFVLHLTYRWEREHQYPKSINRGNKNFTNLPLFLLQRHQEMRSVQGYRIDLGEEEKSIPNDIPVHESLPIACDTLPYSERPFQLNKHILRRVKCLSNPNLWFYSKRFLRDSAKNIYCEGILYKRVFHLNQPVKLNDSLSLLEKYFPNVSSHFIMFKHLHFANDYKNVSNFEGYVISDNQILLFDGPFGLAE